MSYDTNIRPVRPGMHPTVKQNLPCRRDVTQRTLTKIEQFMLFLGGLGLIAGALGSLALFQSHFRFSCLSHLDPAINRVNLCNLGMMITWGGITGGGIVVYLLAGSYVGKKSIDYYKELIKNAQQRLEVKNRKDLFNNLSKEETVKKESDQTLYDRCSRIDEREPSESSCGSDTSKSDTKSNTKSDTFRLLSSDLDLEDSE